MVTPRKKLLLLLIMNYHVGLTKHMDTCLLSKWRLYVEKGVKFCQKLWNSGLNLSHSLPMLQRQSFVSYIFWIAIDFSQIGNFKGTIYLRYFQSKTVCCYHTQNQMGQTCVSSRRHACHKIYIPRIPSTMKWYYFCFQPFTCAFFSLITVAHFLFSLGCAWSRMKINNERKNSKSQTRRNQTELLPQCRNTLLGEIIQILTILNIKHNAN